MIFRRLKKAIPERFGDLVDGFFVLSGKPTPALFIEKLEDPHQVFVVGDDRIGQDLFGPEAGAFIVGCVVEQGRMDRLGVPRCCRRRRY